MPAGENATGLPEMTESFVARRQMWRESDEITKFLSRVVILAGNSRTRADSFASSSVDKDFWMRLVLAMPVHRLLPQVVYRYLSHGGSLTCSDTDQRDEHSANLLALARTRLAECRAGTPGRSVTVCCNMPPGDARGLSCGQHARDGWWTPPGHCGSWRACRATGVTATRAAVYCHNMLKNPELSPSYSPNRRPHIRCIPLTDKRTPRRGLV